MNDISPIGRPNMPGLERPNQPGKPDDPQARPSRGRDAVELTPAAQMLSKLHELPEVRQELIDKAQANIEAGHSDDPQVIDQTVDKLLAEEAA